MKGKHPMFSRKLNQRGASHHFLLPVLAVAAVMAIGGFVAQKQGGMSMKSVLGVSVTPIVEAVLYTTNDATGKHAFVKDSPTSPAIQLGTLEEGSSISRDRKWVVGTYLTNVSVVNIATPNQVVDVAASPLCSDGANQYDRSFSDSPYFLPETVSTIPTVYYVRETASCVDGSTISSAIYRSKVDGTERTKLVDSTSATSALQLRGVGANGTIVYGYVADAGVSYLRQANGTTKTYSSKNRIIAISGDGKRMLTWLNNGQKIALKTTSGKTLKKFSKIQGAGSYKLNYTGNRFAYIGGAYDANKHWIETLKVCNVRTGKITTIEKFPLLKLSDGTLTSIEASVSWSRDDAWVSYSGVNEAGTSMSIKRARYDGAGKEVLATDLPFTRLANTRTTR